MKDTSSPTAERNVVEPDEVDLGRATYAKALSYADFDEERELFVSTMDRMAFKSATEVVLTVLEANGYVLNIENILACLDQLRFGLRVKPTGKKSSEGKILAKSFMPSVQFPLPSRRQQGELLDRFYREIQTYEAEVARLQTKQARGKGARDKSAAELRKEIKSLREQNEGLQHKVALLSQEISELKRSHADVSRALAAQNYLPSHVRVASVHEVDLDSRHVSLKTGRRIFSVPLVALWNLPRVDEACLVSIRDGAVVGVFFHEDPRPPPVMQIGTVLYIDSGRCKIRDDGRRTRLLEAQNDAEQEIIAGLARGERLLLFLDGETLVRFSVCRWSDGKAFGQRVQESIARHAIGKRRSQTARAAEKSS